MDKYLGSPSVVNVIRIAALTCFIAEFTFAFTNELMSTLVLPR